MVAFPMDTVPWAPSGRGRPPGGVGAAPGARARATAGGRPPGGCCPACSEADAREPAPDSGTHPRCLGLALARRPGTRPAPRPAGLAPQSRLLGHRGAHPRVGHRRERRHVQHRSRRTAATAAVPGRQRHRADRRLFRPEKPVGHAAVEPLDALAAGALPVVRAARSLRRDLRRVGRFGWCRPARRQGLALTAPAAAGDAPTGTALLGGRSADGRRARRAAEPRRLDEALRVGLGHRRHHDRPGRRPAPCRRRAGRGVWLPGAGQ